MNRHVSWPSIELLHNVVRTFTHLNGLGQPFSEVTYRAKIKLHGSNCAVQVHKDGILVQSRTQLLTPESDYLGFAQWVLDRETFFKRLVPLTIFGEWCGPGVQKKMAISHIPNKIFAVFALQYGYDENARVVYDPALIKEILFPCIDCPDLFILPWENDTITLHFGSKTQLESSAARLNELVELIEKEDPWVKRTFGLSGIGEGLVFYPVALTTKDLPTNPEHLASFMFKAKGEKHRTASTKKAAQVDASTVQSITEFADLMLTESRLQQGLTEVCGGTVDPKRTGDFLIWIANDVRKESVAELEASGLTWDQVVREIQTRSREWYKGQR